MQTKGTVEASGQEQGYPFSEQNAIVSLGRGFDSLGKVGVLSSCVPREWHASGSTCPQSMSLLQQAKGGEEMCYLDPGQKPTRLGLGVGSPHLVISFLAFLITLKAGVWPSPEGVGVERATHGQESNRFPHTMCSQQEMGISTLNSY